MHSHVATVTIRLQYNSILLLLLPSSLFLSLGSETLSSTLTSEKGSISHCIVLFFPVCHVGGITHCEIILVCFPSLHIMHLKLNHMAAYISSSFLLLLSGISLDGPQFAYPFPQLRVFGLFQFVGDPTENFCSHIQFCFFKT